MKKSVSQLVSDLLKSFLDENGYELYDVAFVKEGPDRFLRVFIDKQDGVSLDDCEAVSKFLSAELDKKDPIMENYYLEVSSPGVERELKTDAHFERYNGEKVEIKLYNVFDGQKLFTGKLISKGTDSIVFFDDLSGKEKTIPFSQVARVKLLVEF